MLEHYTHMCLYFPEGGHEDREECPEQRQVTQQHLHHLPARVSPAHIQALRGEASATSCPRILRGGGGGGCGFDEHFHTFHHVDHQLDHGHAEFHAPHKFHDPAPRSCFPGPLIVGGHRRGGGGGFGEYGANKRLEG